MKNSNFFKNSIVPLLSLALSMGVLFGIQNKSIHEASGYSSSGLPTTIYLDDCNEAEIKSYYSKLKGLSSTQLQGDKLLSNLKSILMNNQKYYKYDGGSLWQMYEITDRDWKKSPASSTSYGTYDETNNRILNYQYGSSESNSKNNPYLHALYVDRDVENETTAWDDHGQTQWGINQEHIWPKSQGFNNKGEGGARGDPMHLWAGNGRVNGVEHNNNMYGFVDKTNTTFDGFHNPNIDKGFSNLKDNYSGKSLTIPTSNDTVFEPQDSDKGDIARAIFYMVARYNNVDQNDRNIDQDNPNLALKQTTESLASYTTTNFLGNTGYMGLMTDLLIWNHMDPVDEYEIHRNNLLYKNFTNNRNPFIDYPEWADYIWGKPSYSGRQFLNYSPKPTGYVDFATDRINGFKNEVAVTIENIEIEKQPAKVDYFEGETFDKSGMVIRAIYSDGSEKTITNYTISPSEELTLLDDSVEITFNGKTATIDISVSAADKVEKSVIFSDTDFTGGTEGSGSSVSYVKDAITFSNSKAFADEKSNPNILRMYSDSELQISSSRVIKSVEFEYSGSYSLDKTLFEDINSKNFTLVMPKQVRIKSATVTYIDLVPKTVGVENVSVAPSSSTLEIGESIQLSETILPTNATNKEVIWTSLDNSVATVSQTGKVTAVGSGNTTIKATSVNGGKVGTSSIVVNESFELDSLTIDGDFETEFYVGDEFNYDGLTVFANYVRTGETKTEEVTDDVIITPPDMTSPGNKTVLVSFGGKTASYNVVIENNLTEIVVNDEFELTNNTLNLGGYTDGKKDGFVWSQLMKGSSSTIQGNKSRDSILYNEIPFSKSIKKVIVTIGYKAGNNATASFAFGNSMLDMSSVSVGANTDYALNEVGEFELTPHSGARFFSLTWTNGASYFGSIKFVFEGTYYQKVTQITDLTAGSKVVLGYEIEDTLRCLPNVFSNGRVVGVDRPISNDTITAGNTNIEFEIGSINFNEQTISFKAPNNKYLSPGNNSTDLNLVDGEFIFAISNSINGGEFAFKSSASRAILYHTGGVNMFGNYATSNLKAGGTEYFGLSLYAIPGKVDPSSYIVVNDVDDLRTGDEIIFAGSHSGSYYSLSSFSSTYYTGSEVTMTLSSLTIDENIKKVMVVKEDNGLRFKTDDGFISSSSNSTVSLHLEDETTLTDCSLFNVNIDASGIASISSFITNEGAAKYLRFNYNGGSTRFCCYSDATSNSDIVIYKKSAQVEADVWSKAFLDGTENCIVSNWRIYASGYNLLSDEAKQELINAEACADDKRDDPNHYNFRSYAVARYDYMLQDTRYSTKINAFIIGRGVTPANKVELFDKILEANSSTAVIAVLGVAGVTAIGGYFVYKRRKEQN